MNKKYIVLLLFLVSIFIYMPVNVRAGNGSCSYKIDEIRSTDAKLVWSCTDDTLNSWELYSSDSNCNINEKIDSEYGLFSKEGSEVVKKLEPDSYYFAYFIVNGKEGGKPNVCFKTAASSSGGKVVREVYAQESRNKCDIKVSNILTNKFTVDYTCNKKNSLFSYNIDSCSLHKTDESCSLNENNLLSSPDYAYGKKGKKELNGLEPNSYYGFSCRIDKDSIPNICIKTAASDIYGQIISYSESSASSSFDDDIQGATLPESNGSGNGYGQVHNTHASAQDATANSFLCKEDELNKESEEYKNSLSYLIDKYWAWVYLLIPIALLIFISLDFLKAVFSGKSDDIKKASSNAIKRVIAALLLMLTPLIVKTVFGIFGLTFCF